MDDALKYELTKGAQTLEKAAEDLIVVAERMNMCEFEVARMRKRLSDIREGKGDE